MEIPDDMVADYRAGSIDAFIAWVSYIAMVWSFKGALMFLYSRMTCVPPLKSIFPVQPNQFITGRAFGSTALL